VHETQLKRCSTRVSRELSILCQNDDAGDRYPVQNLEPQGSLIFFCFGPRPSVKSLMHVWNWEVWPVASAAGRSEKVKNRGKTKVNQSTKTV
jgi:hypothetical protein